MFHASKGYIHCWSNVVLYIWGENQFVGEGYGWQSVHCWASPTNWRKQGAHPSQTHYLKRPPSWKVCPRPHFEKTTVTPPSLITGVSDKFPRLRQFQWKVGLVWVRPLIAASFLKGFVLPQAPSGTPTTGWHAAELPHQPQHRPQHHLQHRQRLPQPQLQKEILCAAARLARHFPRQSCQWWTLRWAPAMISTDSPVEQQGYSLALQ